MLSMPSSKTKQANKNTWKYLVQNKRNCSERPSKSQAFLCFQSSHPQSVLFNLLISGMVALLQNVNFTSGWQLSLRMAALPKDGSAISRRQLLFEIEALLNMTALPQMLTPCQDSNSASRRQLQNGSSILRWQLHVQA